MTTRPKPEKSLFCRHGEHAECRKRAERQGVAAYVGHWDRRPCQCACHTPRKEAPMGADPQALAAALERRTDPCHCGACSGSRGNECNGTGRVPDPRAQAALKLLGWPACECGAKRCPNTLRADLGTLLGVARALGFYAAHLDWSGSMLVEGKDAPFEMVTLNGALMTDAYGEGQSLEAALCAALAAAAERSEG